MTKAITVLLIKIIFLLSVVPQHGTNPVKSNILSIEMLPGSFTVISVKQ